MGGRRGEDGESGREQDARETQAKPGHGVPRRTCPYSQRCLLSGAPGDATATVLQHGHASVRGHHVVRTIRQPPRGQRCLPATFQPLTTHAKAHRQPPILACCNCTYCEQDDGACRKGREAGRCSSNTRFALRHGTHVDHLCFLTTQEPAGIRETGGLSKAQPHSGHPCGPATVRRTQSFPFHFFGHDPGASARNPPSQTARRFSPGLPPATPMRDG